MDSKNLYQIESNTFTTRLAYIGLAWIRADEVLNVFEGLVSEVCFGETDADVWELVLLSVLCGEFNEHREADCRSGDVLFDWRWK